MLERFKRRHAGLFFILGGFFLIIDTIGRIQTVEALYQAGKSWLTSKTDIHLNWPLAHLAWPHYTVFGIGVFFVLLGLVSFFWPSRTPKLVIDRWNTLKTRASDGSQRLFVQILVKCGSEGSIDDCRGYIKQVSKWSNSDNCWIPLIDQSLPLLWSNIDQPICTLWFDLGQALNVFFIDNITGRITPCSQRIPFWMSDALSSVTPSDILKFDILITAKDCAPASPALKIELAQEWDEITIEFAS
jgi:hypothetical protein